MGKIQFNYIYILVTVNILKFSNNYYKYINTGAQER